jgi:hypothetical protein
MREERVANDFMIAKSSFGANQSVGTAKEERM